MGGFKMKFYSANFIQNIWKKTFKWQEGTNVMKRGIYHKRTSKQQQKMQQYK